MRTRTDRGSGAVEFGLLVAGIAVVIVAAVSLVGNGVQTFLAQAVSSVSG